jgi:hypothetical protein
MVEGVKVEPDFSGRASGYRGYPFPLSHFMLMYGVAGQQGRLLYFLLYWVSYVCYELP